MRLVSVMAGLSLAAGLTMGNAALAADADRADYEEFVQQLGDRLGFQGEFALRIIALGLENAELAASTEKRKQLSPESVVCNFQKPTGKRYTHVMCREMQHMGTGMGAITGGSSADVEAHGSGPGAPINASTSKNILVYPAREREVEKFIEMLPGLPSMNKRLVFEGMASRSVPEGLPTKAELDRFVDAYAAVRSVRQRYDGRIANAGSQQAADRLRQEADAALSRAIREAGLAEDRYNQIVEHVSSHPELFNYVKRNL